MDPAALLDGWEVVKQHDDKSVFFDTREKATYTKSRAEMDGGALVENWRGDTEKCLGSTTLDASSTITTLILPRVLSS